MVVLDPPFGFNMGEWDKPDDVLSPDQIKTLLNWVNMYNKAESWVFVTYLPYRQYGEYAQAPEAAQYGDVVPYVVYKPQQNYTGYNNYLSACEFMLLAFKPEASKVRFLMDKNPLLRHNLAQANRGALRKYFNGQPINLTEKPSSVMEQLVKNHSQPNDVILMLGTGAGGDVMGALNANRNVVGIEIDAAQVEAMITCFNGEMLLARQAKDKEKSAKSRSKRQREVEEGNNSPKEFPAPKVPKLVFEEEKEEPVYGSAIAAEGDAQEEVVEVPTCSACGAPSDELVEMLCPLCSPQQ